MRPEDEDRERAELQRLRSIEAMARALLGTFVFTLGGVLDASRRCVAHDTAKAAWGLRDAVGPADDARVEHHVLSVSVDVKGGMSPEEVARFVEAQIKSPNSRGWLVESVAAQEEDT